MDVKQKRLLIVGVIGSILILVLLVLLQTQENVAGDAAKALKKYAGSQKSLPAKNSIPLSKLGARTMTLQEKYVLQQRKLNRTLIYPYPLSALDWSRLQKIDGGYERIIGRELVNQRMEGILLDSIKGLRLRLNFCSNGLQDAVTRETDVDCGGNCGPCGADRNCIIDSDCESNVCRDLGEQRGDEHGICATPVSQEDICIDEPYGVELQDGRVLMDGCDGNTIINYSCAETEGYHKAVAAYTFTSTECPEGTLCRADACRPKNETCEDNDPSNNPHLLGIVVNGYGEEINRDRCIDDRQIRQANCRQRDGYSSNSITSCPFGEICSEGICVEAQYCSEPNPQEAFPNATVFVSQGDTTHRHIDVCADQDTVQHIICDGSSTTAIQTDCPAGLSCLRGLCGDHSEGHCIETEWGAIDAQGVRHWNSCGMQSPRLLYEENCIGEGIVAATPVLCPTDKVCFNGACVQAACADTDGGRNIEEVGEVSFSMRYMDGRREEGTYQDHCPYNLWIEEPIPARDFIAEQTCDEYGRPQTEWGNCPEGQRCVGGACVEGESMENCTDTDGDNILTGGEVRSSRVEWPMTDYCENDNNVIEWICRERGYISGVPQDCPESHPWCNRNACSKGQDDDYENDVFRRGTARDIHGTIHPDFCRGNTVVEVGYDPETGEFTETELRCPEGARCEPELGACIWQEESASESSGSGSGS